MRNEIRAIIESKPANLINDLAGYAIRIRNEAFLAGHDKPPMLAHELQKPLDSVSHGTLKILKTNVNRIAGRKIADGEKVADAAIKRPRKNIANMNPVHVVIERKRDKRTVRVGSYKAADAGDSYNANVHKSVATRSNESSSATAEVKP